VTNFVWCHVILDILFPRIHLSIIDNTASQGNYIMTRLDHAFLQDEHCNISQRHVLLWQDLENMKRRKRCMIAMMLYLAWPNAKSKIEKAVSLLEPADGSVFQICWWAQLPWMRPSCIWYLLFYHNTQAQLHGRPHEISLRWHVEQRVYSIFPVLIILRFRLKN